VVLKLSEIMTEIQRTACPHCRALNFPQDALCLNCGKPIRVVAAKTLAMDRYPVGLNARQKVFLRRYVRPIAIFILLYVLLAFLFKFPSENLLLWLAKPIQRPSPRGILQPLPVPWWFLLAMIDGAITTGLTRVLKPVTWED